MAGEMLPRCKSGYKVLALVNKSFVHLSPLKAKGIDDDISHAFSKAECSW